MIVASIAPLLVLHAAKAEILVTFKFLILCVESDGHKSCNKIIEDVVHIQLINLLCLSKHLLQ